MILDTDTWFCLHWLIHTGDQQQISAAKFLQINNLMKKQQKSHFEL